jgi:hypothetical protein
LTLTEAYTTFLRTREGKDDFVAALQRAGHSLEAELLMDWTSETVATETGDGRRAWVGPTLPKQPEPGDLWLDVVEAMPMVHTPAPGWLALRPVARWQFAGFLENARTKGPALDRQRLLNGPETDPITRVLREEASLYAQWFGKLVAERIDWQLASDFIDPAALWGPVPREWSGEEWDDVYGVTDLDTLDLEDDLPDDLIFRAWEAPDDVTFRTIVPHRHGLITETAPAEAIGVALSDQAKR